MQCTTLIRHEGEERYGLGGLFGRGFYDSILYAQEFNVLFEQQKTAPRSVHLDRPRSTFVDDVVKGRVAIVTT